MVTESYPSESVNMNTLPLEIDAGSFGALGTGNYSSVTANETSYGSGLFNVDIVFTTALSGAEKTELDGIISSHVP